MIPHDMPSSRELVESVREWLERDVLTGTTGRLQFHARVAINVLAMVAEFESDLIRLRTVEGMKVARAKGRLKGKQPKLNRKQESHLVSLVHSGEYSTLEVAELFGVGRSTVGRVSIPAVGNRRIRPAAMRRPPL